MNDRARFDVLVAPRVGSVIEAQQQAFAEYRNGTFLRHGRKP